MRWKENVCKDSEGLKEKRKTLQVLFLITPGSTPMFHMGNRDVQGCRGEVQTMLGLQAGDTSLSCNLCAWDRSPIEPDELARRNWQQEG